MTGPTAADLAGPVPVEQALRDRLQLLVGEATMAAVELERQAQAFKDSGLFIDDGILAIAAALRAAAAEAAEPMG